MKIGFWTREDTLLNNYVFFNRGEDASFNTSHNIWVSLYEELKKINYNIQTIDLVDDISSLDCVIFLDFPEGKISPLAKKALSHKKKILITFENEVVAKNNWNISNHNFFDVILTWNDDYIDNAKYFKIMVPGLSQHYQEYDLLPFHKKENLSCMVSWNKKYNHRNETQNTKIEIIKWFEKNKLNDFHLYGPNWDEKVFSYSSFLKFLNYPRFKKFRKFFNKNKFISWKGKTNDKQKTIRNYKFCFIIENVAIYNGYITDKIFDCFFSGTVPIYLGAKNIFDFIPQNCLVDLRDFKNNDDLYFFLKSIDESKYKNYINNIQKFLKNDTNYIFTFKYFNNEIIKAINLITKY